MVALTVQPKSQGVVVVERAGALVIAAVGMVGGALGVATSGDAPSLVFGGGFGALAFFGFVMMWRSQARDHRETRAELADCHDDRRFHEWRFDVVRDVMQESGMAVPSEVWMSRSAWEKRQSLPPS